MTTLLLVCHFCVTCLSFVVTILTLRTLLTILTLLILLTLITILTILFIVFIVYTHTHPQKITEIQKVMDILERRNEAIMISLDVDGAFDRMWHEGLLHKMEMRGMRGRALKLAKDYLHDRFIEVVVGMIRSALKRIFSGVPQGGKFSQNLWDFDISTLHRQPVHL